MLPVGIFLLLLYIYVILYYIWFSTWYLSKQMRQRKMIKIILFKTFIDGVTELKYYMLLLLLLLLTVNIILCTDVMC